ncbi:unnamed protein product [Chrysoparadoxa australica]
MANGSTILLLFACLWLANAHRQCINQDPPSFTNEGGFCVAETAYGASSCCSPEQDAQIREQHFQDTNGKTSELCATMHRQVLCLPCEPWAAHMYESGDFMLKNDWCDSYAECSWEIGTYPATVCDTHTRNPDPFYSFPWNEEVDLVVTLEAINLPLGGEVGSQIRFPNTTSARVSNMVQMPSTEWMVLDQAGRVFVMPNRGGGQRQILDIRDVVSFEYGEEGLLGIALQPDFEATGLLYLNYVSERTTHVSRFHYNGADIERESETRLLSFHQPYANHNGGWLGFSHADRERGEFAAAGQEYSLFIATGDGGGAYDPANVSSNFGSLLGKILRVNVGTEIDLYSIPSDNPLGSGSIVWAYGLRNPWNCNFDRVTDELYCADVGQNRREEVNIIQAGGNYGWKQFEGSECVDQEAGCDDTGHIPPIYEYCHLGVDGCESGMQGNSITGGFIYRGGRYPEYNGSYIFADWETKVLQRIFLDGDVWTNEALKSGLPNVTLTLLEAALAARTGVKCIIRCVSYFSC